jgi:uncharacterized membrane protein YuzA (DUF378 family)
MVKKSGLDLLAMILVIIGGLNWGLVGLFDFDVVAWLGSVTAPIVATIVYVVVGIAALYMIYVAVKK